MEKTALCHQTPTLPPPLWILCPHICCCPQQSPYTEIHYFITYSDIFFENVLFLKTHNQAFKKQKIDQFNFDYLDRHPLSGGFDCQFILALGSVVNNWSESNLLNCICGLGLQFLLTSDQLTSSNVSFCPTFQTPNIFSLR